MIFYLSLLIPSIKYLQKSYIPSDILNYILFQDFIRSQNLKKSGIKEYAKTLNQYCNFTNKNPTELIEKPNLEEDQQIHVKTPRIKKTS